MALVVFACSVQTRQGHLLSAKCTPFGTHTARGHTGANGINRRGQRNIFYKSTKCLRLSKSAATCSNRVAAATRGLVIYSFYIEHTFCRRNCQLLQTPVSVAVPNFVGSAELHPLLMGRCRELFIAIKRRFSRVIIFPSTTPICTPRKEKKMADRGTPLATGVGELCKTTFFLCGTLIYRRCSGR